MTKTIIYIWGIADNFGAALHTIAIVTLWLAATLLVVSIVAKSGDNEIDVTALVSGFKKALGVGLVSLTLAALTPSSQTVAAMVVIPEIANSDVIKHDLPDIYKAAIRKLTAELATKEGSNSE